MKGNSSQVLQKQILILRKNIIRTLAYADIFDYPLKAEEIEKYLINNNSVPEIFIKKTLSEMAIKDKTIGFKKGYFFLKNKDGIVKTRKEREKWSKEKLAITQKAISKIKLIPTVKMVGVTGTLAMSNCQEDDDIDLLVVSFKNSLWLTRFLIIFLCPFFRIKRRKNKDKEVKNKICLNLFLEENNLIIKPENLFLAHEITQIKPIYDPKNIFLDLLKENSWVKKYLPNYFPENNKKKKVEIRFFKKKFVFFISCLIFPVEKLFFVFQYWFMKSKITNEKISLFQAFFHPENLSIKIEKRYLENCRRLGLDN